ncbi:cysteine hydrolase family protein [Natrarchaeobius chitinivorans]|nr:isochorismatase family cysteine hydrolase [Natrarchaeobius chitinivorans]
MIPDTTDPAGSDPALLVVDMQCGAFNADSDAPMACTATSVDGGLDRVAEYTNDLVEAARNADVPIIWGKEQHRPDLADYGAEFLCSEPIHALENSEGVSLASAMDVDDPVSRPAEYEVTKRRYDLFFRTDLEYILETYDIDTVIVTGIMTNICVHYTAHGAHQRDYAVRVPEECTAAPTEYLHEAGLKFIEYLQPDSLQSVADVIGSLETYEGNAIVRHVKETGTVDPSARR